MKNQRWILAFALGVIVGAVAVPFYVSHPFWAWHVAVFVAAPLAWQLLYSFFSAVFVE